MFFPPPLAAAVRPYPKLGGATEFLNAREGQWGGGGRASPAQKASNAANPVHSPNVPEPASSSLPMMLINWLSFQSKRSFKPMTKKAKPLPF